jgi:hypothetical protein
MRLSNTHTIGPLKLIQGNRMRNTNPEIKLPDNLKDRPITLAMWLVGGMAVMLVIGTLTYDLLY